ncbi:MAG: hypothetical protein R6W97_02395 [Thiobacillus sp.]
MMLGLACSAHVLAWDELGDGWYAEKIPRTGNPETAMIRSKQANYVFLAEYDCKNRMLLTYDLAYVGLPVPKNQSASAMYDYACKDQH